MATVFETVVYIAMHCSHKRYNGKLLPSGYGIEDVRLFDAKYRNYPISSINNQ